MDKNRSFRFVDDDLNRQLLGRFKKANIEHVVTNAGVVCYAAEDEETVENELISAIRDRVFPRWQVLTCPNDWAARYRDYMARHQVPYHEELSNGELWFLIPRNYRPHRWNVEPQAKAKRVAVS